MKTTEIELLKTKRFLPLFITQFLGAFNDNTFKNALVILITYRLASIAGVNAQILVVFAAGIFILPFFLFSATAGQLADKYEKSRLISIIKVVEILLMLLVTVGFYFQSISMLMFSLFLLGTHSTFFGPLKYAILPDQLRENELIAGNGLIEAGTFIAILVGTLVGGLFVLQPHGETFISLIVLAVAIAGWSSSLFIPATNNFNPELKVRYNIFRETYQLIRYSKKQWDIFLSILGISWFWLVGSIFLSEFPVFAKNILHANQNIVTFFLTLFSIGLAIGSLLCNKLLKGKVHATYVPLGALGITLFTVDLYFASSHVAMPVTAQLMGLEQFLSALTNWRVTVDLLLISICGGIYTVPLYAILQQRSEKAHRARVIASNNVINSLFMVVAALATMIMLSMGFSVIDVFLTIAIANAGVAIYICKLLPDVLIRSFFHFILKALYRVNVKGLDHYHQAGERVVIVANHTSFLDAVLLATFLPDKLTFAVNTTVAKKRWIKFFLRMVDAFPIDPTNPMAIKSLVNLLQQDKRCVIFPEGRLTMTGALMKIYEGPGLIADRSGAKLLPIHIDGAQRTVFSRLKGKFKLHWMPTITLTIFPAEPLELPPEIKGRKRREKIGYQLYDLMTRMQFESSDYKKTLFSSLINARSLQGSHTDIMEDIERKPINYQTFIRHSFILGGCIAKKTTMGEHVGILLPNMISTVTTFFALQAFSRTPAMLNYSTGINNVVMACQTANIRAVYTSLKFIRLAKLTDMVSALKNKGITVIYLEELRTQITWADKIKGLLLAQFPMMGYHFIHRAKAAQALKNPNSTAVILFTSGSEGSPKAVVLSHMNIQANRCQLGACIDFTATDKVFNALPIFHSFGLTAGMLLPLLSGVKVFFYPSPLHYRIIPELVYDTNSTILFGTDTFLSAYAKHAHPYDFYSVRYVFAGAEKLRDETRINWSQKFGVRIFEGYGATETAPVISMNTPMQNKIGTVGRFLPGIQYRLDPVPGIAEGGILSVLGSNIMKGYLLSDKPGLLVAPEQGWYNTGDIISIDESGFITIKGRVKRFAKIAGEMVSLTMVEQEINKLWPDYQHAVINKPDPKKGEQLILFTTYPDATREMVVNHAKTAQMGEITIPKKIIIIKKMSLLSTGKIDYTSLSEEV